MVIGIELFDSQTYHLIWLVQVIFIVSSNFFQNVTSMILVYIFIDLSSWRCCWTFLGRFLFLLKKLLRRLLWICHFKLSLVLLWVEVSWTWKRNWFWEEQSVCLVLLSWCGFLKLLYTCLIVLQLSLVYVIFERLTRAQESGSLHWNKLLRGNTSQWSPVVLLDVRSVMNLSFFIQGNEMVVEGAVLRRLEGS